jgi:uncharacterized protein
MSNALWQGLQEFNRQEFYACHDTLEALWAESGNPVRQFYQGILQIAVAYYHLGNGNWRGTVMLLGQGIQRLDYFLPEYEGVAIRPLVLTSQDLLNQLYALPEQDLSTFIYAFPTIEYHQP